MSSATVFMGVVVKKRLLKQHKAAPEFSWCLLLGNGITANSPWVALATLITPAHPFCGQIKEATMGAAFVPLYRETNCKTIYGWDLLNT